MKQLRFLSILAIGAALGGGVSGAPLAVAAGLPKDVQALLARRCGECHGEKNAKSKLTLTTPAGIVRGGRKGGAVRPGKPEDSRLWQMVRDNEMPPDEALPAGERELLRRWIADGASGLPAAGPAQHWAFTPPVRPTLPAQLRPGARLAIDQFLLAGLETQKLAPQPEAPRATLIRRVAFDLTGLPPTPAEIDAYLADRAADSYERMIDRYLASPHYGERWGKHWLDAVGYADSNGYFNADSDRPLAWKYRDYVVRSLNADKPYDRFVREQLAGDELAGYVPGGDITPAQAELLIATHFLRNAPDGTGESDGNPDEVRIDRYTVLEGNLQNTMNSLLGVTIQCARCHAHKFEPIEHAEYYRLQAIFLSAYSPDRWVKPNERVVEVGTRAERDEHRLRTERVTRQVQALRAGLEQQAGPYRELLVEEKLTKLDAPTRSAVLDALRQPADKQTAPHKELLRKHVEPLKITEDGLAKRFPEFAALRDAARRAVAEREKERPAPLERLSVLVDLAGTPTQHHLLLRGQHNKPGPAVEAGVPVALTAASNAFTVTPPPQHGAGRRLAFARWMTSPANPLFARVFVNRVWLHHFGKGLVATPDNFGISGAQPSHPELLDWLAADFVENGYSIKRLHRLMLNSRAYRQSSQASEAIQRVADVCDPDNRLLWHFPLRRLDAEALRDAQLAIAGELDGQRGGPYVPTQRSPEGNVEVDEKRPDARRRSLYLQQRRTQVATMLELFDAPSITATCSERNSSTVPLQALALLNSDFARRRATAFAARLSREGGAAIETRLNQAFRLACGRPPRPEEAVASTRFLDRQRSAYAGQPTADARAWADFCQMLLASNAFLYVE